MASSPLALCNRLAVDNRCYVHPEVYYYSQARFDALKTDLRLLGVTVVDCAAAADFMLYDPAQTDVSSSPVLAVEFTWVDRCLRAGELLPFGRASQLISSRSRSPSPSSSPDSPTSRHCQPEIMSPTGPLNLAHDNRMPSAGNRCYVHPEVYPFSQPRFEALKCDLRRLGLVVVDCAAAADFMLYDAAQTDPSKASVPAIKFTWVDDSLKVGEMLPFGPYAADLYGKQQVLHIGNASSSIASVAVAPPRLPVSQAEKTQTRKPQVSFIDLTQDSSDDDTDWSERTPDKPGGRRDSAYPAAKIVPNAGPSGARQKRTFAQINPDAEKLPVTKVKSFPTNVLKPSQSSRRSPIPGTSSDKGRDLSGPDKDEKSDSEEEYRMFIRRLARAKTMQSPRTLGTGTRHRPPEHVTARLQNLKARHGSDTRPNIIITSSESSSSESSGSSPRLSPSKRRCIDAGGRSVPIAVGTSRSQPIGNMKPALHSGNRPQTISSDLDTKNPGEANSSDESDPEERVERLLEFKRIRHVFRHHAVAPRPPPRDAIENEMHIVDEGWDRWFLSFIDWALEHEPSHTRFTVFEEMRKVTKIHQQAFATMAMRLDAQVSAAFKRVRGNGYPLMSTARRLETLPEKRDVMEQANDSGPGVSEMDIEQATEHAEHKDGAVSEDFDDIPLSEIAALLETKEHPAVPGPDTPEPLRARWGCEESPDAVMDTANGAPEDEQQPSETQDCQVDEDFERVALAVSWTRPDKMFCAWEWLSLTFQDRRKSKEDWERLYRRMEPAVTARAKELEAAQADDDW